MNGNSQREKRAGIGIPKSGEQGKWGSGGGVGVVILAGSGNH